MENKAAFYKNSLDTGEERNGYNNFTNFTKRSYQ